MRQARSVANLRMRSRNAARLPRSAHWIHADLIGVRWPVRSRSEHAATRSVRRIATELMVDRCHRVLRYAPRVVRLHRHRRWYHQCSRLPGLHPVVATVPWALRGLIACPVIAPSRMPHPTLVRAAIAIRIRCVGNRMGLQSSRHAVNVAADALQMTVPDMSMACCWAARARVAIPRTGRSRVARLTSRRRLRHRAAAQGDDCSQCSPTQQVFTYHGYSLNSSLG